MRAVIYTRVSTVEQTENYSLAVQEAACREYCQRRNMDVAEVFRERGVSAKSANRPALHEMLDYCGTHAKAIDVVLV